MPTTISIVEALLENASETYEHQDQLIDLTTFEEPPGDRLQISGNVYWRPVQQHSPDFAGWDLSGSESDIIEEGCPYQLGTPDNDWVQQRADDLRDIRYWERRGVQAGMKRATNLNKAIATAVATQGTLHVRSNAASGYDALAEAATQQNERQLINMGRCFILNDRDTLKYGRDLANRDLLGGNRPETAYAQNMIGKNVAGYDVYTGSYLPNLAGGASPDTTVTGNQSFAPESGVLTNAATGMVTNIDYRVANIAVAASASYNIGDKVKFTNTSTGDVEALGLADKTVTGQPMTFTIVAKPSSTQITVYPKPIAVDDSALSTLEKAYANVDTTIKNGATVVRLNTDASARTNLFFDKSAVTVTGGTIPAQMFEQFNSAKVVSKTLSNGLEMYALYDGNIATMNFRYRLFIWYGVTVNAPQNCGILTTF